MPHTTLRINLVPTGDAEGRYTDKFRASLLRSIGDLRHGRTHSVQDVRKRLGLKS